MTETARAWWVRPADGPGPGGAGVPDPSPVALAYLGDAVYELYVRSYLIEREGRRRDLTRAASRLVSAAAQSRILAALEPALTEAERDVVRRGRNANIGQAPRGTPLADYRRATGLECLFGYLLRQGEPQRLAELLEKAVTAGLAPVSPEPAAPAEPADMPDEP